MVADQRLGNVQLGSDITHIDRAPQTGKDDAQATGIAHQAEHVRQPGDVFAGADVQGNSRIHMFI